MELNLKHETICLDETAYDSNLEQSIEHEYQLPDYYPGIFKLLKCSLVPHICGCRTSADQLAIDGVAVAKLLYADEEDGKVHSLVQKLSFSKTVELKGAVESPSIDCKATTDYVNCRIISSRKIDIRGAVTIHLKVDVKKEETVLKDADGAGTKLNRNSVAISSNKIYANRQFSVSEQLETEPTAEEILDVNFKAVADDCKLIANKAVTKGTGYICILYRTPDSKIEKYKTTIPISQIVDMPSIDEDYVCAVNYDVTMIDTALSQEGAVINLNADITVDCTASLTRDTVIVSDAYSTEYALKTSAKEITSPAVLAVIHETLTSEQSFDLSGLKEVYNIDAEIADIEGTAAQNKINFTAKLNLSILGLDRDDSPKLTERTIPIEFSINKDTNCLNPQIATNAVVSNCEYSFVGSKLELKADIKLNATIICFKTFMTITDIVVDETAPHKRSNSALTLYYPDEGDSIFNIAKHFLTSPDAIKEANALEGENIDGLQMLMIPIVK